MAGAQHILAAQRHLRAEQRGYGTVWQDGRMSLFALGSKQRESLPFASDKESRGALAIYLRQLLAPLSSNGPVAELV